MTAFFHKPSPTRRSRIATVLGLVKGLRIAFCLNVLTAIAWLATVATTSQAATVYWDLNDTTAGSGGPSPSGVWNTSNLFWNDTADGTGTLGSWIAGDTAVFSAGSDAIGSYAIQIEGVQSVGGLRFANPTVDPLTISLTGGTLEWATAGTLEMTTGTTAVIASQLTGSGNITHSTSTLAVGNSILVLSGNNGNFTGNWSLSGGTTELRNSQAAGTGSITLGNTATRLDLVNGVALSNALIISNTGNEKVIRATSGTAEVNSVITQNETTLGNIRLEANSGATLIFNSDLGGGAGGLRTGGSGLKILTGNNTYTGETLLYGGSTQVGSISTNLGAGTIRFGTTTTGATLIYTGSGETVTQAIRLNGTTGGGTLSNDGTGALIINTMHATYGDGAKTFTLSGSNTDLNEFKGNISQFSGTSTTGVTKAGEGTWMLSGTNTFTGQLRVNGGTLILASAQAAGNGTLRLSAGSLQGNGSGPLTLANPVIHDTGTVAIGGTDKLTFNGSWLTSGGTRTLTVDTPAGIEINGTLTLGETTNNRTQGFNGAGNVTINGAIVFNSSAATPTGALSYTGNGTLTLTGTNTYRGTTTLNNTNGTLVVSGTGTLGDPTLGNLTVNAGTLQMQTSVNHSTPLITMGGGAAGSQAIIDVATGLTLTADAVTFSATNNNQTALIQGNGTLNLGTSGITVTIGNSSTVDVDMAWNIATVTGSGAFVKAGAGTLDVSGVTNFNYVASSYEITGGALLGVNTSTSNLILNGGVFEGSGTFSRALGTGNGQVQWLGTGGGGFSANGGDLTVTLSGAPDPIVWGSTPQFVANGTPLIFGSTTATDRVFFMHNVDLNSTSSTVDRTINVIKNAGAENDMAILSGVLSNSDAAASLTKGGNGTLELTGANTFTGGVTVLSNGILRFSTVSNNGGPASNLGQGSDGITLSGGTLAFAGDTNQATNRATTLTVASFLSASGTDNAAITYNGAISAFSGSSGYSLTLNGNATSEGIINGRITQAGTAADINVFSGKWTINGSSGTPHILSDDIIVTGPTAVLQLGATGSLSYTAGTSNYLYVRDGGLIRLMADDVTSIALGTEGILVADTAGATATFDLNGYNLTVPRLDLGNIQDDGRIGHVIGGGTLTVTNAGTGLNLRRGLIESDLAGTANAVKLSNGEVTFRGDNNARTGATTVSNGLLTLDYANGSNTDKLGSGNLTLNGGALRLLGNASAASNQTAQNGITFGTGGSGVILEHGGTQNLTLHLGEITRTATAATANFTLSGNSVLTTTSTNDASGILGGWATHNGTRFASVDAGTIVAAAAQTKDNLATWLAGDNLTDLNGYTGTVGTLSISSLIFESANPSTVTIGLLDRLTIESGGILITEGSGANAITGGRLWSNASLNASTTDRELFVHQYNTTEAFTISAIIDSRIGVTKSGPGTLILDGFNDFNSRQTTINEGVLRLGGGSALGNWSTISLADKAGVELDLNNTHETVFTLAGGGASGGLISIGSGSLTIRTSGTYSGRIAGSGDLIKSNSGTLTLNTTSHTDFTGNLIVSGGQITLDNRTVANFPNVGSVTLNAGSLLLAFNGGTESSPNKINNTAPITLINTGGLTGLRANNDQADASKAETIGAVTLLGGANTIAANHSNTALSGTQRFMTITMASLNRENQSTLLVRGKSLGTLDGIALAGHGGRIVATTAPTLVGTIVPWMIGDPSVTGNGTSFVTHATTTGFRPLNLTTDYEQLTAAGGVTAANQVRYSSATSLTLSDPTARTMNSLLIDNTGASSITVDGAGAALNVASGAFLFTGAQTISVENFSDITTSSTTYREYVVHVVNTSVDGVTVAAPFTTAFASFTKSGDGLLKLTSTGSTYTGQTAINQGVLEIGSLQNLGNTGGGGILFNGGTLRFGAAFDLSESPVRLGVPATGTVQTTQGGTLDTNGFDITLANSIGGGGNGGLTKTGNGILTLAASANYGGLTTINGGTLAYGTDQALPTGTTVVFGVANTVLDLGSFSGQIGSLEMLANGTIAGNGDLAVTGNFFNTSNDSRTLTISNDGDTSFNGDYFVLTANNDITSRTVTVNVTGAGTTTINGEITNGPSTVSSFTKSGNGTLVLGAANTLRGTMRLNGGTLIATNDLAMGYGLLRLTTGTLQGDGTGDRSFANNVTLDGNTSVGGTDKITFTGPWLTSGGTRTLTVDTTGGVEISGVLTLGEGTSTRAQGFAGSGEVLVSGVIQNNPSATTPGATTTALQYTGTGTMTLTGANTFVGRTVLNSPDGTGSLVVSAGSSLGAAGAIISRAGTLRLEHGVQSIHSLTMGDGAAGATSIVDLGGGGITLGTTTSVVYTTSTQSGTNFINNGTVYLNNHRTFEINDSTETNMEMVINAQIVNNLSSSTARTLTKTGNGTLALTAANTYTGATSITAGTLLANNLTGSATGTNTVAVSNAGTTLGGMGFISNTVTLNADTILSPGSIDPASGDSLIGRLAVGGLNADASSTLTFQLGGATTLDVGGTLAYLDDPINFTVPTSWMDYQVGTTQHDQLYVSGSSAPSLNTATQFQISDLFLNSFVPEFGHVFQLLDWAMLGTNSIASTPTYDLPDLSPSGLDWNTDYLATNGVVFVVPEPSRTVLMLLGLLSLISRRRRMTPLSSK